MVSPVPLSHQRLFAVSISMGRPVTSDPLERTSLVNDALTFATRCLGPHSARLMDDPAALARVLSRVRNDCTLEDAVLGVVFLEAKRTPVLTGG